MNESPPVRFCSYEHCDNAILPGSRIDKIYCCRKCKELATQQKRHGKGAKTTEKE